MEETTNTTPATNPAVLVANLTYMLNVQETGSSALLLMNADDWE